METIWYHWKNSSFRFVFLARLKNFLKFTLLRRWNGDGISRIVLVLALVAISFPVLAQEAAGLRKDIIAAPLKFTAGGEKQLFSTPLIAGMAFGYNFFGLDLSSGLYGTFSVNTLELDEVKVGGMFHTKIYKEVGVGVWYDFWQDGVGFVPPTKARDNWGFALSVDFTIGGKEAEEKAQTFGKVEVIEKKSKETAWK